MTVQNATLLVDWNGRVIPNQYYDANTGGFVLGAGATAVTKSSTITLGGTPQTVMVANTSRKGYFFQNISTETMWGSFLGNAAADTAGSFEIAPKAVISSGSVCETNALSVVSATTGSKFTAWEM